MSKTIWILIILAALGFGGWGVAKLAKEDAPTDPDHSVFFPAQNQEHIQVGAEHPAYSSNPPSGGWHYSLTAKKRFYDEPIDDGYVIHNLEHGDIWITYHPRVPESVKNELKQFAFSKVLISPREANETDIALVAWERVDAFNLENEQLPEERINNFIKQYRNKGPEKLPAGAGDATFN